METDPETQGIRGRVRWANVGRALALVAVAALVVAWPRLRAPAPEVPRGAAVPVRTAPVAATPVTTPEPEAEPEPEPESPPAAAPHPESPRTPVATPPPAPAPWRAPSREFGVE